MPKGEGLIVLEPADGQWGTREEEQDYVNAAMSFARSGRNANNVPVFSVYGEFYLVGYGASAAPLEAWAAEWPIYVISQVYIDGTGAGRSYLDATEQRNTMAPTPADTMERSRTLTLFLPLWVSARE